MCVLYSLGRKLLRGYKKHASFPGMWFVFMRNRVESWCVLIQLPRHRGRRLPHDASPALARSKLWPPVNDRVSACVLVCDSQTHSCLATPEHVVVPLLQISWDLVLVHQSCTGNRGKTGTTYRQFGYQNPNTIQKYLKLSSMRLLRYPSSDSQTFTHVRRTT